MLTIIRQQLASVSPSSGEISFEAICEHLLTSVGYRITRRHLYDGTGGDVDLHCIRERAALSPFESGETVLYVQAKKHIGTTDQWAVEQLLKMIEKEPEADACVMSLADGFSDDAHALAAKNGVVLMNGESICTLLLTELAKQSAESRRASDVMQPRKLAPGIFGSPDLSRRSRFRASDPINLSSTFAFKRTIST